MNRRSWGGEQTLTKTGNMSTHKGCTTENILTARRDLSIEQPAELPALLIVLVAVGWSYRVLSKLCCVMLAALAQTNARNRGCKGRPAIVMDPATTKLSLGLEGTQF